MTLRIGSYRSVCSILLLACLVRPGASFAESQPPIDTILSNIQKPRVADFDPKSGSRFIRALVAYNKTGYFLDGAQQSGMTYEAMKGFETFLNKKFSSKKGMGFQIIFIPVSRDKLLPYLEQGRGDIAAASLTITSDRKKQVAFADPFVRKVDEIPVAAPGTENLKTLSDLSGREIWVRRSSSYFESLTKLNRTLSAENKPPVKIRLADEILEDEDLLENVQAGLIPMTVVDGYLADFWSKIFTGIKSYPDIKLRSGGEIAWAVRRNNPKLKALINEFVKSNKQGTLTGNVILQKYLGDDSRIRNALAPDEINRLREMTELFKVYGGQYGFDWLVVAAQAYQESRLDQNLRSPAGAVGVMQLLPQTAADPAINVPDIEVLANNIHAGVKYLRWIADNYFKDNGLDEPNRWFFAFAAYNAGPNRIVKLRKKAAKQGYDPNRWFKNVEVVAARDIGQETVQYVSNIYRYYLAYQQSRDLIESRDRKKQ